MEPISIGTARNGLPTAHSGSIRIHSAYDPRRECERFLDGLELAGNPGTIIVIGAGLGYLDQSLSERFPSARIIAMHLDAAMHKGRIPTEDSAGRVRRWHPDSDRDAEMFLFESLTEMDIPGLKTVEWPASLAARPGQAKIAADAVAAVIRRYSGNISATAAFGRHWIRNTLRNFIDAEQVAEYEDSGAPVLLAASGPSLEEALPLIAESRTGIELWALPSALPALASAGLTPNLIFATDPGHWARLHSRHFIEGVPVTMPLSAAPLPPQAGPPLLIPQGTPGESRLLASAAWPFRALPAMGTVAATAVEAWKRWCTGPLVVVGLDMAWTDLRSHARPHAFDGWLAASESRSRPHLTVAWERAAAQAPIRSGRMRTGSALRTYTDWFRSSLSDTRAFRLRSSESRCAAAPLPGLQNLEEQGFRRLTADAPRVPGTGTLAVRPAPLDAEVRRREVRRLIDHWAALLNDEPDHPETRELLYVLDPGGILDSGRRKSEDARSADTDRRYRGKSMIRKWKAQYA